MMGLVEVVRNYDSLHSYTILSTLRVWLESRLSTRERNLSWLCFGGFGWNTYDIIYLEQKLSRLCFGLPPHSNEMYSFTYKPMIIL